MADLPSVKWLGLGATAAPKSSAARDGDRQKREAQNTYSQTLPPSNPVSMDTAERDFVTQLMMPVGAAGAVSAPLTNMPSQAELAVLQDLGWQTPGLEKPANAKADDTFNYQDKKIQQGQAFDYGLDAQQIKNLEDLYRDTPGFKPPDADTATSIRVMAEQNELAPVTWKQWDKMTPDQQQAATWNSQLWKASQRDIKLAGKRSTQGWDPERQQQYDDRVTAIFGEGGGSEIRAINTLKLLEEINFTAVGQDLDEYLSGERLITAEEMKNFKVGTSDPVVGVIKKTTERETLPFSIGPVTPLSAPGPRDSDVTTTTVDNYEEIRSTANLAALDAAAVRALDTEITERMSSAKTAGWNIPSVLSSKDEKWTPDKIPMGYSNPAYRGIDPESNEAKLEQWYKDMWLNINDPEQKVEDVLAAVERSFTVDNFSPQERQEVWDWLDKQTSFQLEYGQPTDIGFSLRDPQEIRRALGWEK
jgi:hypothetical protein